MINTAGSIFRFLGTHAAQTFHSAYEEHHNMQCNASKVISPNHPALSKKEEIVETENGTISNTDLQRNSLFYIDLSEVI